MSHFNLLRGGLCLALLSLCALSQAAMSSSTDTFPTHWWQVEGLLQQRRDYVTRSPTLETRRAQAAKAIIAERVATPAWINTSELAQPPAASLVPLHPSQWQPTENPVAWLFILITCTAVGLIAGAIRYELRRLREKQARLAQLRLQQLTLIDARAPKQMPTRRP